MNELDVLAALSRRFDNNNLWVTYKKYSNPNINSGCPCIQAALWVGGSHYARAEGYGDSSTEAISDLYTKILNKIKEDLQKTKEISNKNITFLEDLIKAFEPGEST